MVGSFFMYKRVPFVMEQKLQNQKRFIVLTSLEKGFIS